MALSLSVEAGKSMGPEERIDPTSPWWGEHVARYEFALPHIRGRSVLDVACGTGYGLRILQREAAWVVGLDLDPAAVERAKHEIFPDRGEVVLGDGTRLPHTDGRFAAITSFETLEHVEDRPAFLCELRRVLEPDGVLLLSTPNALYTLPIDGQPRNPFHLHEYEPDELVSELRSHFSIVELYGQFLNSRFVVPPFQWDQREVTDGVLRAGIAARRVLHRFPSRVRNAASRLLWNHDFFPQATDYRFSKLNSTEAPVLLAVCRASTPNAG